MSKMHLSQHEIFAQAETLDQTFAVVTGARDALAAAYRRWQPRAVVVAGCGSSYCVALSIAAAWQRRLGLPVQAVVGSDLLRHPAQFDPLLRGGLLVTLSRSGKTTELLAAVEQAQARTSVPVLSVSCAPGSPLEALAGLVVSLPWSHEVSVCQTRSVSNLALAALGAGAIWGDDEALLAELARLPQTVRHFLAQAEAQVAPVTAGQWTHAVLLGDGELFGAAAEGAMILTEMAQVPTVTYHTLDVRHGPAVLLDADTLAVLFRSGEAAAWEPDLVADLRAAGAHVLAVGAGGGDGSDDGDPELGPLDGTIDYGTIDFGGQWSDASMALLAGLVPQVVAFGRALGKGLDPDRPRGLTQWIDLGSSAGAGGGSGGGAERAAGDAQ